jgi:hypothetical protein
MLKDLFMETEVLRERYINFVFGMGYGKSVVIKGLFG